MNMTHLLFDNIKYREITYKISFHDDWQPIASQPFRLKTNLTTDTVRALHPNRVVGKVRRRRDGDVVDRQGAESAEWSKIGRDARGGRGRSERGRERVAFRAHIFRFLLLPEKTDGRAMADHRPVKVGPSSFSSLHVSRTRRRALPSLP